MGRHAGCINKLIPPLSRSPSIILTLLLRPVRATSAVHRRNSGKRAACVRARFTRAALNTRCDQRAGEGGRQRGLRCSRLLLLCTVGYALRQPTDLGSNRPSLCELRSWIRGRSYFTVTLLQPGLSDAGCPPRTDDSALGLRSGLGLWLPRLSSFHGRKIRKVLRGTNE